MHIYLVDDEPALLASMTMVLRGEGYKVQSFATADAFLSLANDLPLGCVLLDLCLPDLGGLEVQARLVEMEAEHAVVLVTGHGDVPEAVTAMRAGAVDFLRKPCRHEELLSALDRASAQLNRIRERRTREQRLSAVANLSLREQQVLVALANGSASKVVAHAMGLSVRTIETHRANILKKLKVQNIGAALVLAQAAKLVDDRTVSAVARH